MNTGALITVSIVSGLLLVGVLGTCVAVWLVYKFRDYENK